MKLFLPQEFHPRLSIKTKIDMKYFFFTLKILFVFFAASIFLPTALFAADADDDVSKIIQIDKNSLKLYDTSSNNPNNSSKVARGSAAGMNVGGATSLGEAGDEIILKNIVRKMKGKMGYTHLCIVLDASGSMQPFRDATVEACNKFLKLQKAIGGDITLDIWVFSAKNDNLNINKIVNFVRLSDRDYLKDYDCFGTTPCYDAIGMAIEDLDNKIKMLSKKKSNPETVIFVVFTDGVDNSSSAYNIKNLSSEIRARVEQWNFVYFAIGYHTAAIGLQLGLPAENCFDAGMRGAADIDRIWFAVDLFSRRCRGVK